MSESEEVYWWYIIDAPFFIVVNPFVDILVGNIRRGAIIPPSAAAWDAEKVEDKARQERQELRGLFYKSSLRMLLYLICHFGVVTLSQYYRAQNHAIGMVFAIGGFFLIYCRLKLLFEQKEWLYKVKLWETWEQETLAAIPNKSQNATDTFNNE